MTKLGIIGAMTQEVETLVESMAECTSKEIAGSTFYEGTLDGLPAVIVQCGVGKVNAALCAQILCSRFSVTHLVNTGIAGSLSNDLDIADLVVSRDAMYHAFSAAEAVNPCHTKIGRVASGDQFIADKEKKDFIIEKTQALCTEMEGAAIAQTAYRNGVPFVILRAISDKADNSAEMDYPTFETLSAHRCAEVTHRLARTLLEAESA